MGQLFFFAISCHCTNFFDEHKNRTLAFYIEYALGGVLTNKLSKVIKMGRDRIRRQWHHFEQYVDDLNLEQGYKPIKKKKKSISDELEEEINDTLDICYYNELSICA